MATTGLRVPSVKQARGDADEDEARRAAARRPFECDLPGTPEEFAAMFATGERQRWPEVSRAGLYGLLRHSAEPGGEAKEEIGRLLDRASRDGDDDMVALALAWRAWVAIARKGEMGGQADDDLARAAVMLESPGGDPVVRAAAHFRVAFSFWHRRLWELADEQFAATEAMVEAVDPYAKDPLLHRAALALDRVMVQVDLAYVIRELGDLAAVRKRRKATRLLVATTECLDLTPVWRDHVRVAALLVDVLAGLDRHAQVTKELRNVSDNEKLAEWEAHLYLAKALHADVVGHAAAVEAVERAIDLLRPASSDEPVYFMALRQAAALEAASMGKETAGLRCADALAAQRERGRLASVAGMRATLASERLRKERDDLLRHADSDPLTGLANRRGFARHVENLLSSATEQVAYLVFDLDNLKPVNDRFGHAAGDAVLLRMSQVLRDGVREGDFAARVGGDEFVLLLIGSGRAAAARRADEIAAALAREGWEGIDPGLRVSVSAGFAAGHPSEIEKLAKEADFALLRAKSAKHAAAPDLSAPT
ncbi:MAG: GGDEF domain-containing protein [Acidimicrobiales bacterium]